MINGSAINSGPINGPTVTVLEAIKASSNIPTSARQEFNDFIGSLGDKVLKSIESILNWFQNATQSDLASMLYQNLDQIIQIIQNLL